MFLPFSCCFLFSFLGCSKSVAALQDSLKKSAHSELALFALYWFVVTFPCGIVHILVMIRLRVAYGGRRVGQAPPSHQSRQKSALDETADALQSSPFSLLSSLVLCFIFSLVLSCLVLSCLVLSCLVLSCLVLSCLVLSCLVLSCLVLSCLVLSCLVLSCLVLSCLVLSCLFHLLLSETGIFQQAGQEADPSIMQHAARARDNFEEYILERCSCPRPPRAKCGTNFETQPPTRETQMRGWDWNGGHSTTRPGWEASQRRRAALKHWPLTPFTSFTIIYTLYPLPSFSNLLNFYCGLDLGLFPYLYLCLCLNLCLHFTFPSLLHSPPSPFTLHPSPFTIHLCRCIGRYLHLDLDLHIYLHRYICIYLDLFRFLFRFILPFSPFSLFPFFTFLKTFLKSFSPFKPFLPLLPL